MGKTISSPPLRSHRCRTIPCVSIRKKARSAIANWAYVAFRDKPPYCRVTFRSGKSLSSGNGSCSDSANVFCEKGWFVLIPRIWTFSAWNLP